MPSKQENLIHSQEFGNRSIDIQHGHTVIQSTFVQFYIEQGYTLFPAGDLLPEEDTSVLFTGATITPLKKYLKEGIPEPGFCMVQKCLRTKRLNEITDLSKIPDWTHYFTMCGILGAPNQKRQVLEQAFTLLTDRLHIPKQNLLLEASSEDRDLSEIWSSKDVSVAEDTHPITYYRWKYGVEGVSGRGVNILFRLDEHDSYRDLGNIISLHNNDNEVIGYEFGFGLESMLSKMYGLNKPVEASLISAVIPYKEGLQEKLIDTLMAASVIYHHGVEPGRGKQKHVLKKLVKGISYLRRKMDISLEQIKEYADLFEGVEFTEMTDSGTKLVDGVIQYEDQVSNFKDYLKNQIHARTLRGDMNEHAIAKFFHEGTNRGLLPDDINETLTALINQK